MSEIRWRQPKRPKYEQLMLVLLATLIAGLLTVAYSLVLRVIEAIINYQIPI